MTCIFHPIAVFMLVLFAIQAVDCETVHDDPCAVLLSEHSAFHRGHVVVQAFESQLKSASSSSASASASSTHRSSNLIFSPLAIYNSLYLLWSVGKASDFSGKLWPNWQSGIEKWQHCIFSQTSNTTLSNVNAFILDDSLQFYNNHHLDGFNNMFNTVVKSESIREWFPLMCLAGIRDFTSTQLLVDADVQFAAQLALPFRREEETQGFLVGGEVKSVEMMSVTADMRFYGTVKEGDFVEIPYEGNNGNFALYLHLVPRHLIPASLNKETIDMTLSLSMRYFYTVITNDLDKFDSKNVELHVPRFELQPLPFDLEDTVRALGLGFLYEDPHLTGIVSDGTLMNIKMIHRTTFTVAENPKKASANNPADDTTFAPEKVLRFDSPFFAIVLHRPSNTPVLAAYIQDPTMDPVISIAPPPDKDIQAPPPPVVEDEDNISYDKATQHIIFAMGDIIRAGVDSQLQSTTAHSPHNIVISPFTIYNSLYLLHNGSACKTAADLMTGLRLPPTFKDNQLAFKLWKTRLFPQNLHPRLRANALTQFIVDDSLQLDNDYAVYVNRHVYKSEIQSASIHRATCSDNNADWLNLVCMSPIRNDFNTAQLLVITALAFNPHWTLPLQRLEQTEEFHTPTEVKQVNMTNLTATLRYYRSQTFGEIVEILYGGNENFVLYLHMESGVVASRMRFFYGVICTQMVLFRPKNLELHVPSFELRPDPFNLEDTIRKLGLGNLLENADLSGIVSDGTVKNIKMIHNPSFTVAESQAPEIPLTQVFVNYPDDTTSAPTTPAPATVLRFNRPFYAIVLHRPSNTPVISAYIQDPALDPYHPPPPEEW